MDLRRGSQAAVERVVEFLSSHAKTITTTAEIAQVATISANGDSKVGNLIAQAMEKVATTKQIRKSLCLRFCA